MDFFYGVKKLIFRKKYKEYLNVKRQLKSKQIQSSAVFVAVKTDAKRSTADDPELIKISNEANQLAVKLMELEKIFGDGQR